MTATTKQLDYIATLTAAEIAKARTTDRKNAAAQIALILALPTPITAAEASEVIDALKGGVMAYWRNHRTEAAPVIAKLGALIGKDGSNAPATNDANYIDIIRAAIA